MPIELIATALAVIAAVSFVGVIFLPKLNEDSYNKRIHTVFSKQKNTSPEADDASDERNLQTKKVPINEFREGENSKSVRLLRKGQKILKASDALQNSDLRLLLAQSGYRGMRPLATYVLFRFLGPPVIAVFVGLYLYFLFPKIAADPLRFILFIAASAALGFFLPPIWVKNQKNKRQESIKAGYPDVLDLVMICTESGMSLEVAFRRVSDEIGGQNAALGEELELLTAEMSYLSERRLAYENFAKRTDLPQVRSLSAMIIQAEQYGTPVSKALRILAEETRDERTAEAERKAAALPSKLTVPMMLFFMPSLFIVILTPAVISIMDNF